MTRPLNTATDRFKAAAGLTGAAQVQASVGFGFTSELRVIQANIPTISFIFTRACFNIEFRKIAEYASERRWLVSHESRGDDIPRFFK
jgi:hypothetical protein